MCPCQRTDDRHRWAALLIPKRIEGWFDLPVHYLIVIRSQFAVPEIRNLHSWRRDTDSTTELPRYKELKGHNVGRNFG